MIAFQWNGTTYTESGTYTFDTTNTIGCDSTATLNLIINNKYDQQIDIYECNSFTKELDGIEYTFFNDFTFVILLLRLMDVTL